MKTKYKDVNMRSSTLEQIERANEVIDVYAGMGLTLSLRQLYYQMVARGYLPNTEKSYDSFGRAVSSGRDAGLIDWDMIEDRTRNLAAWATYKGPDEALRQMTKRYKRDHWATQPNYVEVWVEKEALAPIVQAACQNWITPHLACRGYMSTSEMELAGRRYAYYAQRGKGLYLIHLGDHDPSGIDMSRDIIERVSQYMSLWSSEEITLDRIALNMDQVRRRNPPPNPAKLSDSRASGYISQYGRYSWELDALPPDYLNDLIASTIRDLIDEDEWKRISRIEAREKEAIRAFAEDTNWEVLSDED